MTFRAAGAGVRGTGTSAAIPVYGGAAAKDIAVINLYVESADAIDSFNFEALGFTVKIDTGAANATSRGRLIIAYKRLTEADSGTYTVTWTTSALYTGVSYGHQDIHRAGDPFDVVDSTVGTSTTTVSFAQAITTTKLGDLILAATSHATNGGDFTPAPAGMTERYDSFASFGVGNLAVYTQDAVAPGAQSKTTTTTGTTGGTYVRGFIGLLKAPTLPEAPTVRGYAELTTGDVSWTYPSSSDERTSQEIRVNGGTPVSLGAADSTYHITGLTNETVYTVEVRGINDIGTGPWSLIKRIITGSSVGGVNRRYFTAVQTWTPPAGVTSVKRLIVGGGASGGTHPTGASTGGAGGGAGGVDEDLAEAVTPGTPIDVVGGHGGIGQVLVGATWRGNNGELSKFGSTICDGGGGGGTNTASSDADGAAGGSGGGGGGTGGGGASTVGGAATGNGIGNAGGSGYNTTTNSGNRAGGGGGGADGPGTNASSQNGGEGGDGYLYDTSVFGTLIGESNRVAAGGGGGRNNSSGGSVGVGGLGGGANGAFNNAAAPAATDLTGSGGGGGGNDPNSGRGSDGFVVLVWEDPEEEPEQTSYWGIKAA